MQKFSKSEAISFGIETFVANWGFLVGLTLIILFINFVPSIILNFLPKDFVFPTLILGGIFFVVTQVVNIGSIFIYLSVAKGEKGNFGDLLSHYEFFFSFVVASILSFVVILVGLILFIIPGIILAIRLSFWAYALVEGNLGPIAALKESWRITKGQTINLSIFYLLLGLLNLVGLLALGVGLFITTSITQLATVFVFRKLSSSS